MKSRECKIIIFYSYPWPKRKRQINRIKEFSGLIPNMTLFNRKPFWKEEEREVWDLSDSGAVHDKDYIFDDDIKD